MKKAFLVLSAVTVFLSAFAFYQLADASDACGAGSRVCCTSENTSHPGGASNNQK